MSTDSTPTFGIFPRRASISSRRFSTPGANGSAASATRIAVSERPNTFANAWEAMKSGSVRTMSRSTESSWPTRSANTIPGTRTSA